MNALFGVSSSPYDEVVERATHANTSEENWALILDICDKVRSEGQKGAKNVLLSIKKRLNHRDPHVVLLAFSVLDSCMVNCGLPLQQGVCTKEFLSELKSKATCSDRAVGEKARLLLKKWAESECKSDASLSLIPTLVQELKRDGYSFEGADPPKKSNKMPSDPNYVSSKEEEDAIAKAIQASLKESSPSSSSLPNGTSRTTPPQSNGMYPTMAGGGTTPTTKSQRRVKALYDFEAAEDNELTFKAGDVITLLDDSDINWWKGSSQRGAGLFPSSFVTADMAAVVIDPSTTSEKRKSVQFDERVTVQEVESRAEQEEPVKIDEQLLNTCLDTLRDADPTADESADPPHLAHMEERCQAQGPLIDAELSEVDRRHNLLADVDVKIRDALALYDTAMQDATKQFQAAQQMHSVGGYPPVPQQPQLPYIPVHPSHVQYVTGADGQPIMVQTNGMPHSGAQPGSYQPQPTYSYSAVAPQSLPPTSYAYPPYAAQPQPNPNYS